jgi:uncharacterized SAM-binding protein YcdF (DUF218 family)
MNEIVSFLSSTGGAVSVFLVAVLWITVQPRSRRARVFLLGCSIVYAACSVYAVPIAASRVLTRGYRELASTDVGPGSTVVVLLGAGNTIAFGWNGRSLSLPNNVGAARVLEAARVFHLVRGDWIISSAGPPAGPLEPPSLVMRRALVQLGVPEARILLESSSTTTRDEAVLVAPMLRALHPANVVLVTSDVHMLRSIGAFRAAGVTAIPAVAPDPDRWRSRKDWLLPSERGLRAWQGLVHELIGIPYYWMRGWWRR